MASPKSGPRNPTKAFVLTLTTALAAMATITLFVLNTDILFSQRIGGAAYAWFGNALVFTAIFSLALAPVKTQPVILAAALGSLLTIGARSEFLGFAFVSLLWTIVMLHKRRFAVTASGVTAGFIVVLIVLRAPFGIGPPSESRVFTKRFLEVTEPGTSQSLHIRGELLRRGWEAIQRAPILGDYGGHTRPPDGRIGNYIHNALSAWHQFGLIPFITYIGLTAGTVALGAWVVFIERSGSKRLGPWSWRRTK